MPGLETQNLWLYLLTEADASCVLELLNEPPFLRSVGDKHVRTLADARTYIAEGPQRSFTEYGFGLWGLRSKRTAEFVGMCGLLKRDGLDAPDLGYALLQRHCAKGYASEAAEAVVHHAARELGLMRILAITALDNPSSIRVLEKLGFRFDKIVSLAGIDAPNKLFVWTHGQAHATSDDIKATQ